MKHLKTPSKVDAQPGSNWEPGRSRGDYWESLFAIVAPWVGFLLFCLKCFGPVPFTKEQEADLTDGGRFWVHLERDIPLYVVGVALLSLLLLLVPWQKCALSRRTGLMRVLAGAGAALFLTPLCFWSALGGAAGGVSFGTLPVAFAVLSAAVSGACIGELSNRSLETGTGQPLPFSAFQIQIPKLGRADSLVFAFFAFFIFVPDPAYLAGRFFQIEELNHWNGFAMSAALAFKHGGALYRDFTPIYGAAWPALLGSVARFTGLKYAHVIGFSMLASIVYFFGLYHFFRFFFKARPAAFAFTLLACVVSVFPGIEPETKSVIWRWNGGGLLRAPVELPFFLLLARFCLKQTRLRALLLGITVGAGFLFALDVGIFIFSTALAAWTFLLLQARTRERLLDCASCFGAAFLTLFAGLLWATRGAILQPQTRRNLFNYLGRATGGEGMLPFANLDAVWVFLFAVIVLLLFFLASEFFKRLRGGLNASDVFLAAAALYPLQRLVYFMGRTHWANLTTLSVPLLIGLVVLLNATLLRRTGPAGPDQCPLERADRLETAWAVGVGVCALLLFAGSKDVPNYPALWNGKARRDLTEHSVTPRAKDGDIIGLPPQYAGYTAAYAAVAQRMRELHQSGLRVRFMDACSTTLYVSADIPPFGKDVFEFDRADTSRREIQKLVGGLALAEADVVVFNRVQFPWPRVLSMEAWQRCRDAMFESYRRGEEHGPFEFWYRKR